jgi:hypothetical protein
MKQLFGFCLIMLCIINMNAIAQTAKTNNNSFDQLIYSKIDFNRLPDDVKQQINKNKLVNNSLFDGVARAFIADIAIINSSNDIAAKISFLHSVSNLKDVKYLSGNRIEIIASIETEASLFKELFLSHSVNANFIEQNFVVYQVK